MIAVVFCVAVSLEMSVAVVMSIAFGILTLGQIVLTGLVLGRACHGSGWSWFLVGWQWQSHQKKQIKTLSVTLPTWGNCQKK